MGVQSINDRVKLAEAHDTCPGTQWGVTFQGPIEGPKNQRNQGPVPFKAFQNPVDRFDALYLRADNLQLIDFDRGWTDLTHVWDLQYPFSSRPQTWSKVCKYSPPGPRTFVFRLQVGLRQRLRAWCESVMDKAFGLWLIWTWRLHRFWDSNPGRCSQNWGLKHCKRKPSSSVPGIMSLGPFKGQPVKCFPQ